MHLPVLSAVIRAEPITAFEHVLSTLVETSEYEVLSVSLVNAGGKSSAVVSGVGSSVRASMWQ